MNIHEELRKKLDQINTMDRGEASKIVVEILKYLMDSIQSERNKPKDINQH